MDVDREIMQKHRELAARFIENFKKFEAGCPLDESSHRPKVIAAGLKR